MMWVGKLSLAVNGKVSGNDVAVSGVTIDSRADCSNQLFVAIAGDRFDGHDFVSGAIESGAVAVMVEDSQRSDSSNRSDWQCWQDHIEGNAAQYFF